jgi:hypothetical protein
VTSALALRQQFSIAGEVLQWVEVSKYLGRLLAQEDDDIQAIRAQLWKAHTTCARVGQVLHNKNVSPHIATTFYKAVVQDILLYGRKTWVLSRTALAHLEGFHIRATYQMAKTHSQSGGQAGPGSIHGWWMFCRNVA